MLFLQTAQLSLRRATLHNSHDGEDKHPHHNAHQQENDQSFHFLKAHIGIRLNCLIKTLLAPSPRVKAHVTLRQGSSLSSPLTRVGIGAREMPLVASIPFDRQKG